MFIPFSRANFSADFRLARESAHAPHMREKTRV